MVCFWRWIMKDHMHIDKAGTFSQVSTCVNILNEYSNTCDMNTWNLKRLILHIIILSDVAKPQSNIVTFLWNWCWLDVNEQLRKIYNNERILVGEEVNCSNMTSIFNSRLLIKIWYKTVCDFFFCMKQVIVVI